MTSLIIAAIKVLTTPGESTVSANKPSQQEALLSALRANQTLLEQRLHGEAELGEVLRLREEVRAQRDVAWARTEEKKESEEEREDTAWSFIRECLLLLLTLARHLTLQLESFDPNPGPSATRLRTPEAAPPLPPDVLSVSQQRSLEAALQLVVSLGLCPYLAPGVGVPLASRTAFGALAEGLVYRGKEESGAERRLLTTVCALLELAELPSLATLVFTRHLGDVMAALCQLGFRPRRPEEGKEELSVEERKTCRHALRGILGRVYQPIVIRELLILQGGPRKGPPGVSRGPGAPPGPGGGGGGVVKPLRGPAPAWLRRLCGQLLSERLVQPNGVQAVVRAILENSGGEADWRKCDGVAKILAACPQQSISPDSYYRQVCPQILDLLHLKDNLTALQFQRVATRALLTVVDSRPEEGLQYLLRPLLAQLQRCTITTSAGDEDQDAVQEWELTRCIEDLYKVCVVGNTPSKVLLDAVGEQLSVLFSLFCFTKKNVSHLRGPSQEIILWFLNQSDPTEALVTLRCLAGLGGHSGGDHGVQGGVAPGFFFSPGSEGGAKLTAREACSDEDEELYERVSEEVWRLECLVHLLAELKDSALPGDLFLSLLQELTSWAGEEEEQAVQEVMSSMTLLEAEQHMIGREEGRSHRLALLQVLAALCEGLPHTALLAQPTQVVQFIEALLQRACVSVDRTPGSPGPGPGLEGPAESQSLSMGMGLVATLLSGPKVSVEDYSSMARLLPPLERLSKQHPDSFIRELASDLRAVIATHGAYRPEQLRTPTQSPGHQTQNSAPKSQNSTRQTQNPGPSSQSSCNQSLYPAPKSQSPAPRTQNQSQNPTPQSQNPTCQSQNPTPQSQNPTCQSQNPTLQSKNPAPRTQNPAPLSQTGPHRGRSFDDTPKMGVSELLLEACDPEVVTRAVALRSLTRMVEEGDREAVLTQEKVLTIFLENLEHEDSFVYLSAIQGLAVLADSFPERILQRILEEFEASPTPQDSGSAPQDSGSSLQGRSLETRLKTGEVLMRCSRAMGDLAPYLGRPLLSVFLRGVRDQDHSVRASSLSNLGELCTRLNYSLGPLAQELSVCLSSVIKTDKEAEVRRAAVHVITLLLRGLGHNTTQVLKDVLLDLYRALKWAVRSDTDDVTVLHAQLALEEMDDIMRGFLFPTQKLEKKIVVLPGDLA